MQSTQYRFALVLASVVAVSSAHGLDIIINPNATLSSNAAALAAFNRAAVTWENAFTDNITVNIAAGLGSFSNNGIIGSTSSVILQAGYNTIRNQMVVDAADETTNGIVAFLPTAAQFTGVVPAGRTISGSMIASKANLKAMGFAGLDASFGANDADITFNQAFSFDFDNSNGVNGSQVDFETVALHEIGHALGFFSGVDDLAAGSPTIALTPLDLFRFADSNLPANAAQFTTTARELRPGAAASFGDTGLSSPGNAYRMSNGISAQASHWRDNLGIGVMDPTLGDGEFSPLTAVDRRGFDLIGWDLAQPVPEPATMVVLGLGAAAMLRRRKKA